MMAARDSCWPAPAETVAWRSLNPDQKGSPVRPLSAAFIALAALTLVQPAAASEGRNLLVIGAESVRDMVREYSDGRKKRFCRVIFTLKNNTGKPLYRARFWVKAANGQRESFGISDKRPKNGESFDNTPCSDVVGKLELVRAICQWAKTEKPKDCAKVTLIYVE